VIRSEQTKKICSNGLTIREFLMFHSNLCKPV